MARVSSSLLITQQFVRHFLLPLRLLHHHLLHHLPSPDQNYLWQPRLEQSGHHFLRPLPLNHFRLLHLLRAMLTHQQISARHAFGGMNFATTMCLPWRSRGKSRKRRPIKCTRQTRRLPPSASLTALFRNSIENDAGDAESFKRGKRTTRSFTYDAGPLHT